MRDFFASMHPIIDRLSISSNQQLLSARTICHQSSAPLKRKWMRLLKIAVETAAYFFEACAYEWTTSGLFINQRCRRYFSVSSSTSAQMLPLKSRSNVIQSAHWILACGSSRLKRVFWINFLQFIKRLAIWSQSLVVTPTYRNSIVTYVWMCKTQCRFVRWYWAEWQHHYIEHVLGAT